MKSADQNGNALRRRGGTILRLVLLAPGCAIMISSYYRQAQFYDHFGIPVIMPEAGFWSMGSLGWMWAAEFLTVNVLFAWFVISLPFLFIRAVGWGWGVLRRRVVGATAYSNAERNRSPVSIFCESCEANGPVLTSAAAIMSLMMALLLCRTILQLIVEGGGGYPYYFGLAPDPSFTWEWIRDSQIGNLLADLLFGLWLIGLPWWLLPRMSRWNAMTNEKPAGRAPLRQNLLLFALLLIPTGTCFLLGIGAFVAHEVVGQKYGVKFSDLGGGMFGLALAGAFSIAVLTVILDRFVPYWWAGWSPANRGMHPIRFWITIAFYASLTVSFVVMGVSFIWSAIAEVVWMTGLGQRIN